jgi:hypothetical protein
MKRFCLYFLAVLFAFTVGTFTSFINRLYSKSSQTLTREIKPPALDLPCARDAFTVQNQTRETVELVLVEASCTGPSWKAQLTLQNIGSKAIRGYEVGNIETYEYKKDVESSQGVSSDFGTVLPPSATKTLNFGAGFRDGLSYGKPTGSIQTNVFGVKRLDYTDGTSWCANNHRR